MDITKTQKAIDFWQQGNPRQAFAIFKTFRLGFTKEEKRLFEITHEVLSGRESFYKQLGTDTTSVVLQSNMIIREYIDRNAAD